MSIYKKTLIIITMTMCGLLAALCLIVPAVILQSYQEVEEFSTRQKMEGVTRTISRVLDEFAAKLSDWSSWDDTYSFIVNRDPRYIASNVTPDGMKNIKVDVLAFFNSSHEVVTDAMYDAPSAKLVSVPFAYKVALSSVEASLDRSGGQERLAGFLRVPGEKPLMLAARPILNSNGEGPSRGTLVFAKVIDTEEIAHLGVFSNAVLAIREFDDPRLPDDMALARLSLYKGAGVFVQALDHAGVAAYSTLPDPWQKPSLIVSSVFPRVIYDQGKKSIYYFILILFGVIIVSGALALSLLNEFVIKRMAVLGGEVARIGQKKDFTARVSLQGDDEFSELAAEINTMLENLERSRHELSEALMGLDATNRAKTDFLANMSHEIRTPLTPVIGYLDILAETKLTPEQKEYLSRVRNSSQILLSTINDILDFSRIESGEIEMEKRVFAPRDIISCTAAVIESVAASKGIAVREESDPSLEFAVMGDEVRLKQIMTNLAGNSVKYSTGGTITIGARLVSETPRTAKVEFFVTDEGMGIPEDRQVAIFLPFIQGDTSSTREFGGTGLGLTISDRLVRVMGGGRINLESRVGAGSRFHFTIEFPRHSDDKGGRRPQNNF